MQVRHQGRALGHLSYTTVALYCFCLYVLHHRKYSNAGPCSDGTEGLAVIVRHYNRLRDTFLQDMVVWISLLHWYGPGSNYFGCMPPISNQNGITCLSALYT